MRISYHRNFILKILAILLVFLLAGCAQATLPAEPTQVPVTLTPSLTATPSPTATKTLRPTRTPRPTKTRVPTQTLYPSNTPKRTIDPTLQLHPAASTAVAGTPIPAPDQPIGLENLPQLMNVARWGKGAISRVAFAPAGDSFIVSSNNGVAIYLMSQLDLPPRWIAYQQSFPLETLSYRDDGLFVRMQGWDDQELFINLQTGEVISNNPGGNWIVERENSSYEIEFLSNDQSLGFSGGMALRPYDDYAEGEKITDEYYGYISAQVINRQSRTKLYDFSPDTIYLRYNDYNSPDGCDLSSFSMCGNVYDPLPMVPFRGAFSSTNRTFALLLRPPDLYNNNRFSILKAYDTQTGALLNTWGSFDLPIEDFAYLPGREVVLVAYTNGVIQLWDTPSSKMIHQAWNFTAATYGFDLSSDGRFALILQPDLLEVRRTVDGAVAAQYEASAYAVSPVDNRIAIGNERGEILVIDLDTMDTVSRMEGHTAVIYDLTFSPDGQLLVSTSEDCSLRSWDVRSGAFQHYFEKVEVDAIGEGWTTSRIFVYDMQFIPGTDQIVGFGSWGTAAGWNLHSGAARYNVISESLEYYQGMMTLNPHFPESFWVVPEEERFYIDGTAYNLENGEVIGPYEGKENQPEDCSAGGPVTADGKIMFTRGYETLADKICVLDAHSLQIQYVISAVNGIGGLYLSPDGTRLYAPTRDGTVFVYQVAP